MLHLSYIFNIAQINFISTGSGSFGNATDVGIHVLNDV
jgi:hypothetical protein